MSRKKVEAEVIRLMQEWLPGSGNVELYKKKFAQMSDKEFGVWVENLKSGEDFLRIVVPNFSANRMSVEDNIKMAKKLGHSFLERIWIEEPATGQVYLTPNEYLTMHMSLRRQSQLLFKKMSVPKDAKSIDVMSGQVTGSSKGSAITLPEAQVLYSAGLTETLKETMKTRGGDLTSFQSLENQIYETGEGSIEMAMAGGGKVRSGDTLAMYMKAMCMRTDINTH